MNIYECWRKIQVHFLSVTALFVLLGCSKFILKDDVGGIFNIVYRAECLIISLSCLILGIKRGFLWYYPLCILFSSTVILYIFFADIFAEMILFVFLNNFSAAFVTSAIGGIIHKIRENNKES